MSDTLENASDERKMLFYRQLSIALVRKLGGSCTVTFDQFDQPAKAIANRNALDDSGIELRVVELGEADPMDIPFQ